MSTKQILYNRFFSHEFSEAELACLLKVFIITTMYNQHNNINQDQKGKGTWYLQWLILRNSTMFSLVLHELIRSAGKIQITAINPKKWQTLQRVGK